MAGQFFWNAAALSADSCGTRAGRRAGRLEVFRADGTPVGSFSSEFEPGGRLSRLLDQLVPASAGQTGGYVRVTSNRKLTGFSLFGSGGLKSLSAIPPQDVR